MPMPFSWSPKKKIIAAIILVVLVGAGIYISVIAKSMMGGAFFVQTTPEPVLEQTEIDEEYLETAQFAGGCFWCVESDFEKAPGVADVVSGYTGGTNEHPTYDNYSKNGHREVVEVTYDASQVTYGELVEYLLRHSDPTDPDGSFYDRGDEYAPAIYYENEEERQIAEEVVAQIDALGVFDKPIAAEIVPETQFWPAEEYHQDYYKKNPLKYNFYRRGSGRDAFINEHWGDQAPQQFSTLAGESFTYDMSKWENFEKPEEAELKKQLSDIQYKVTQKESTERAFDNEYWNNKEEGIYVDVVSGEPLFSSNDKFDSGTGWPSFTKPINEEAVTLNKDYKLILPRTEVRSKYADSHLGHVFNDAPKELGGVRYCMNSASLRFIPKDRLEEEGYGEFLKLFE